MASIYKISTTGNGSISASIAVPAGRNYSIHSVTLKLSAAPTTSEDLTVEMNASAGSSYDTLLYSVDLAAASTTDLVWPGETNASPVTLSGGDNLSIEYANTDARTYGLQITVSEVK